ncbi:tRNA preQ1(34) S-adenosylmethionine ribosyltransferase-isomerase QueA [Candidatus Gracilibacteria bacterium]|nr:tRNA preQ1(34) S-adenosylmethionine ribosyltransferase-isomerase QueA [Candidatus Gracilibacteria bacterium]
MKLNEFDYYLPKELIAQTPITPRDSSKLLVLDKETGEIKDKTFFDIVTYLGNNDVLVLNKTKVLKARLKGKLTTEKGEHNCEVFLHKQINDNSWDCLVYPGKKMKVGTKVYFDGLEGTIKQISDNGRIVEFDNGGSEFFETIEKIGETPIPPYIKEKLEDSARYQTVYSKEIGSVAAPTAGLHFTPDLIKNLEDKGVKIEYVILHIGLGTFKSIDTENIMDYKIHSEYIALDKETSDRLNAYKKSGKNIVSVGTTSTRTLESFATNKGELTYGEKETTLYIYPGYKWLFVDKLITNFHLPKSSLLVLVSSLAGKENIKNAYRHAVDNKYRFFSFGDAMFIK